MCQYNLKQKVLQANVTSESIETIPSVLGESIDWSSGEQEFTDEMIKRWGLIEKDGRYFFPRSSKVYEAKVYNIEFLEKISEENKNDRKRKEFFGCI